MSEQPIWNCLLLIDDGELPHYFMIQGRAVAGVLLEQVDVQPVERALDVADLLDVFVAAGYDLRKAPVSGQRWYVFGAHPSAGVSPLEVQSGLLERALAGAPAHLIEQFTWVSNHLN
jgi:hypothetical protein